MDAMLHIPDPAPYMTKQGGRGLGVIRASARQHPLQMLLCGETPPFWGATDHMRDYTCNHKNWTTLSLLMLIQEAHVKLSPFAGKLFTKRHGWSKFSRFKHMQLTSKDK